MKFVYMHGLYQIIDEADHPEVTSSDLWDHFRLVTAPAIVQCQAMQEEADKPTILRTVVEYAQHCQQKRTNLEVVYKY